MINRFVDHLRKAIISRRQAKLPNVVLIITIVTTCTLAYILLSTIITPANASRKFRFANERGAITVLSAIFLSMASAFSWSGLIIQFLRNYLPNNYYIDAILVPFFPMKKRY